MSNEPENPEETDGWGVLDAKPDRPPGPEIHEEGVLGGKTPHVDIDSPEDLTETATEEKPEEAEEFQNESFAEEAKTNAVEPSYSESSFSGYNDNIAVTYKPSLIAQIWDRSPAYIRRQLHSWGWPPPIDAVKQSLLGPLQNGEAMIIGPMMAGKTTFVGAIQQACLLTKVKENIDYILHFNPDKEEETKDIDLHRDRGSG